MAPAPVQGQGMSWMTLCMRVMAAPRPAHTAVRLGQAGTCRECQTRCVLIVLSGLPAVGKSTIADALGRRIGACVVSVDPIEDAILRAGIAQSFETGVAAYRVAAAVAEHQLRNGLTVIVDAANYLEVGRDIWRRVASDTGAGSAIVQVMCSNAAEHRHRLRDRVRGMDAFAEPTWHDIERRATETEPWNEPYLIVDSAQPVDDNVAAIVAYLPHRGADSNRGATEVEPR